MVKKSNAKKQEKGKAVKEKVGERKESWWSKKKIDKPKKVNVANIPTPTKTPVATPAPIETPKEYFVDGKKVIGYTGKENGESIEVMLEGGTTAFVPNSAAGK
jgi:hypothetical protein